MKRRILFAGENEPLWSEFRTAACGTNEGWEAEFARTAPEATGLLDALTFDAVVGCRCVRPERTRTVGQSAELSTRGPAHRAVRYYGHSGYPQVSRSRTPSPAQAVRHPNVTQRPKPRDSELEVWLPSQSVQSLIAKMRRVPSPPGIYFQVLAEMQSPGASIERVRPDRPGPRHHRQSPAIGQLVVFGLQLEVIQPVEAVIYIGLETTRSLVRHVTNLSGSPISSSRPASHSRPGTTVSAPRASPAKSPAWKRPILDERQVLPGAGDPPHDLATRLLAANLPEASPQAIALAREQSGPVWEAESQVRGLPCRTRRLPPRHLGIAGSHRGSRGPSPLSPPVFQTRLLTSHCRPRIRFHHSSKRTSLHSY